MLICNICTTDYQLWEARRSTRPFPIAAGHEWSGDVVAIGEEVTLFKVGDRVANCAIKCGECINCRMGRPEECLGPRFKSSSKSKYFGYRNFSNYNIFKQSQLIKMNNDIPAECCAMLEPVSTAVGGMMKLGAKPGDNVVVLGAGTMGIVNASVYHALGYRVIITELMDNKLERAASLGWAEVIDSKNEDTVAKVFELTDGLGADVVIPAVGVSAAYEQAFKLLKKYDGRYLLFAAGYPAPELKIDPNEIHYNRTSIIGTYGGTIEDIVLAAKLINSKMVDPCFALEKEFIPLRQIQDAYARAATPGTYRISVDLQGI
jgi:L-iditol 2-dehydrogenase